MRLIHCASRTLKIFNNEQELPDYAILSHRWVDGQEVLFKDLLKSRNHDLGGWQKIRFCCAQALDEGIDYCWIDTCCIDKTSSAELSEAINSMYRYYSNSKVCYSYLVDVDQSLEVPIETQLIESSWFTRCWTLQELLAPKDLRFFDNAWRKLGSRLDLCEEVAEASSIHLSVFTSRFEPEGLSKAQRSPFDPEEWSIAQRMSWASERKATRIEDVAYSLLGIFDVNMPLLYGEGDKAFLRLQEEIIRHSSDQTIFGWSKMLKKPAYSLLHTALLAPSPFEFKNEGDLIAKKFNDPQAYSINNLGLEISLPVVPWAPNVLLAGLNCTRDTLNRIYIFIMNKTDITDSSVRAIYKGKTCITEKWRLSSSTYCKLTIAAHLGTSMRQRLNTLRLDRCPSPGTLLPCSIEQPHSYKHFYRHYYFDSSVRTAQTPTYGLRRVSHLDSTYFKHVKFLKFGLDLELNPICVLSDKTYINKDEHECDLNVDLLYVDRKDVRDGTFWDCTGFEETGWTPPDTTISPAPTRKTKLGIWALKGTKDQYCKFTLADDQSGEHWAVSFQRFQGWGQGDTVSRLYVLVQFHWMV